MFDKEADMHKTVEEYRMQAIGLSNEIKALSTRYQQEYGLVTAKCDRLTRVSSQHDQGLLEICDKLGFTSQLKDQL